MVKLSIKRIKLFSYFYWHKIKKQMYNLFWRPKFSYFNKNPFKKIFLFCLLSTHKFCLVTFQVVACRSPIFLFLYFADPHRRSIFWVFAPVSGSTKLKRWLTIKCEAGFYKFSMIVTFPAVRIDHTSRSNMIF